MLMNVTDATIDAIARQLYRCEYHHRTGRWPDERDVAALVIKRKKPADALAVKEMEAAMA